MVKCAKCKFLFRDYDVGYSECLKADDFSDEEFEAYQITGALNNCPFFEEDLD